MCVSVTSAQEAAPDLQFQHSMGGTLDDIAYDVIATVDGGFFVAGGSTSSDGDLLKTADVQHGGNYDFWFAKLDHALNFQWKEHLGGTGSDLARMVLQTADGGYVVAGTSDSPDLDVSGNHGDYDFWIVKLFASGTVQWNKSFGGSGYEDFGAILSADDGGFVLSGGTQSNDYDVSGNHGSSDFWLAKTDANGVLQWQKCYGGSSYEKAADIRKCPDGGYMLVGFSESNNGDVSGNHGDFDAWVVKTDASGNLQWQRSLGGSGYDAANGVVVLDDGSCVIGGYTGSTDGDVTGNHGEDDAWLVKLDQNGDLQWSKCLGGSASDVATGVERAGDNSLIISCYSRSANGDVEANYGFWDYWLISTDEDGMVQWQQHYGGSLNDVCYAAKATNDAGYILAGYSESQDMDVSNNHGKKDYWVVRLQAAVGIGEVAGSSGISVSCFPQPAGNEVYFSVPSGLFHADNRLSIEVISLSGQVMAYVPASDSIVSLNCHHWSNGLYFYNLKQDGSVLASGKIIIQQ